MKANGSTGDRYGKVITALFVLILIAGLFLRFYVHFMGRSLWEDETHFALNFIKYGFLRLAQPLDDIQAGPILFIWGTKLFVTVFGYTEVAFRSLPWLSCVLTLPLCYYVAKELTQQRIAALLAFLMFSVNLSLLYFSSELKPYGIDVAVYLLLSFLMVSSNSYVQRNRHKLLLIAGCLSILFSNTAFIILFCCGGYMLIDWYRQKKVPKKNVILLSAWAVIFLANYFIFINGHPATADQRANYSFAFCPAIPGREMIAFLKLRIDEIFFTMLLYIWKAYHFAYVALLLLAVATWQAVVQKKWPLLLFTWVPILVHLLLSMLHLYPFWYRLILYLVPGFIILLSYGVYIICSFLASKLHWAAGGVFLLLCIVFFTKENIQRFPYWRLEIKPSLDFVNKNVPADMHVYISTPINAYKYYTYRGYVKDTIYKAMPWVLSPEQFNDIVSQERKPFVFYYGSSYREFGYESVVNYLHKQKLVLKEFEAGGYVAAIVKPIYTGPVLADSFYKVLGPEAFGHPQEIIEPLWRGSVVSQNFNLPAGNYAFTVMAKGSPAAGVYPEGSLYINDTRTGVFRTAADYAMSVSLPYKHASDGHVNIRLTLDNDTSIGNEDRNLFIKYILIKQLTQP